VFDLPLSDILDAWRGVAHVAEFTGLSVGSLGLCFLAAYFGWQVPFVRHVVVAVASLTIASYGGLMVGNHIGRADMRVQCEAEKAEMKAAAKKAADQRDMAAAKGIADKFDPIRAKLNAQDLARQAQVDNDAKNPGGCRLSAAAFKLRQQPQAAKH
jgi:hypothetical protein